MSSTLPNFIPSDVLSYMRQREHMKKNPFWDLRFYHLWLFNFQFGYRPKSINHIILVSPHPISNLKVDLESSREREFKVRNPFLYFQCFTSGNLCDSSPPPRAKIRPVTSEKFSKHGFLFFSPNSSIFFRISIEVTFWLFNMEKYTLSLEQLFLSQVRK